MRALFRILAAMAALLTANVASAQTTLKVVMLSDLKILDPIWTTAYIVRDHGYMVYDTLLAMDAKLEVKPQMAESWKVSDDKLTYTFVLRDGLKFHDGAPVTAEDCVASIKRWGARDAMGQKLMQFTKDMTAVDAKTFTLTLKEPYGMVLESLGKPSSSVPFIMPKRIAETPPDKQISEFIGSGPFVGRSVRKRVQLLSKLVPLALNARRMSAGGFERRLRDPPFRAHRRLPREKVGKRGFGIARPGFECGQLPGEPCRLAFAIGEAVVDCTALFFELGDGGRRILPERLFPGDVDGARAFQPFELRQPPGDRVAARARRRQLVRDFTSARTRFGRRATAAGEERFGFFLFAPRSFDPFAKPLDLLLCRHGIAARLLGGRVGLGPARMDQPRLHRADLVGEHAIAFCRTGLPPQSRRALFLLAQQLRKPGEIGLGRSKLLFGILAPRVQPGNPRRFLKQKPPLGGLRGDDRRDLALAHECRRMGAGRSVGEQQGHVLCSNVAAVDPVGGTCPPLDPAGDLALGLAFIIAVAVDQHRHFGEFARRPHRRSGENDVFHAIAAKRLRAAFAHHPADRLEQVGLAAAVGADDSGQAGLDPELRRFDEALEPAELETPDPQLASPTSRAASRPALP